MSFASKAGPRSSWGRVGATLAGFGRLLELEREGDTDDGGLPKRWYPRAKPDQRPLFLGFPPSCWLGGAIGALTVGRGSVSRISSLLVNPENIASVMSFLLNVGPGSSRGRLGARLSCLSMIEEADEEDREPVMVRKRSDQKPLLVCLVSRRNSAASSSVGISMTEGLERSVSEGGMIIVTEAGSASSLQIFRCFGAPEWLTWGIKGGGEAVKAASLVDIWKSFGRREGRCGG